MAKSLPPGWCKQLDPAKFSLHKYDDDSLRFCILEGDLKYYLELPGLNNNYPLAPYKLEIKENCLISN